MNDAGDFEALAAALPFYVNGSLPPEQRAEVEAALARMPALRAELADVQAIAALVKGGGAEWVGGQTAAPAARLDTLMARIAQEPPRGAVAPLRRMPAAAPESSANVVPLRQRLFRPPYSMALAAGLAAIALVQGGVLMRRQAETGDPYASLSGPAEHRGTAVFTLRLNAAAPWGDVVAFLDSHDVRIVGGPQDGMIDVAPNAALSPARVDALERALRASSLVVFVGRGA